MGFAITFIDCVFIQNNSGRYVTKKRAPASVFRRYSCARYMFAFNRSPQRRETLLLRLLAHLCRNVCRIIRLPSFLYCDYMLSYGRDVVNNHLCGMVICLQISAECTYAMCFFSLDSPPAQTLAPSSEGAKGVTGIFWRFRAGRVFSLRRQIKQRVETAESAHSPN